MPIPNYDDTLLGKYIRAIENPDSIGFKNGKWFQSTRKGDDPNNRGFGVDIKFNDAAIEEAHKLGLKGVKSGESLASAPKTYNIWKHYGDRTLLGNYGSHGNGNMMNDSFTAKVNTPEELIEATNQGIDAAVIKKAPVYGLQNPSSEVPLEGILYMVQE